MVDAHGSLSEAAPHHVQATFCATLIDQWIACGVSHAVVAPGSRSTPMAVALAERTEVAVHVVHDERVAAFVALGLGLSGTPALLLCTSGTAAANFFPAVVEAGLSEIGMIVLTADRPEELRNVGAPQTIDQIDLYGRHVRWSHDAEIATAANSSGWRALANTAWSRSVAGPVQLNVPFREPLLGSAGELPTALDVPDRDITEATTDTEPHVVPDIVRGAKGVVLVGSAHGVDPAVVLELGAASGWPIIADPLSGLRPMSDIASVDSLMRSAVFVADHVPEVIIRIGRPSTSKVLAQWSASCGAKLIQVGGPGRIDPDHNVAAVCDVASMIEAVNEHAAPAEWREQWVAADGRAAAAIEREIAASAELSEPGVARVLADQLPAGSRLTVSSSMPVRDLEWFGGSAATAHCNRGANGIDGVMSTAVGRALDADETSAGGADFVLIGDLAFVHDSNALVALRQRGIDLRIVVVDNDGGGIFSFLPQATALDGNRFEQLFGTPLGVDVLALAGAHGLQVATVTSAEALAEQIATPGPWVCRVPSTRAGNVDIHAALHAAAVAAIDATE